MIFGCPYNFLMKGTQLPRFKLIKPHKASTYRCRWKTYKATKIQAQTTNRARRITGKWQKPLYRDHQTGAPQKPTEEGKLTGLAWLRLHLTNLSKIHTYTWWGRRTHRGFGTAHLCLFSSFQLKRLQGYLKGNTHIGQSHTPAWSVFCSELSALLARTRTRSVHAQLTDH